jgi:hypothetical protein
LQGSLSLTNSYFVINFESFLLIGKLLPNLHKQKFHPNCLHFCLSLTQQSSTSGHVALPNPAEKWHHRIAPHSKDRRTSPANGKPRENTKVVSPFHGLVD